MHSKIQKIILVSSDENLCSNIKKNLLMQGFCVNLLKSGKEVIKNIDSFDRALMILDILTYDIDGLEVLKKVRLKSNIPIIIVTKVNKTFYKVLALDLGADDYIVEPFEGEELIARIKAVGRRYKDYDKKINNNIEFCDLSIDITSHTVIYKNNELKMPPKEFELLYYLASNVNKVFSREELLNTVWGYDYGGETRTVDVHVKRLREKLDDGANWSIKTVWGIGYKFELYEN